MTVLDTGPVTIQLHRHQGHYIAAVPVDADWRCTSCGHRLTVDGVDPIETRRLPPRRWLPELVGRQRAKAQFAWHPWPEKIVS